MFTAKSDSFLFVLDGNNISEKIVLHLLYTTYTCYFLCFSILFYFQTLLLHDFADTFMQFLFVK